MSPDEIQKFGIKNRLPKNVIYKMLEKYHYLKFYKKCKKILDDGSEVSDDEIDDLEMHDCMQGVKEESQSHLHLVDLIHQLQLL